MSPDLRIYPPQDSAAKEVTHLQDHHDPKINRE